MISDRVRNITPSATLAVDTKAKQLMKEGKNVLNFGAGEPDFNTPENIKEAAKRAVDNNITKYTPVGGIPELRGAISEKFKKINGISYNPSEVIVCSGGKHTLYNIAMSILNKGDEAILPVPYWVSFEEIIKLAEGKVIFCSTDDRFKLTAKSVEERITKKTKMLILNSPSNPSGAIVEEKEVKEIAELAVKHNFYVVSDEVYEFFNYSRKNNVSIGSLNDQIKNLTITSNSVSKTYAMTGWRVGYCGANKDIINSMENLQGHSSGNVSNIAQMAALEALNGPQDMVKEMLGDFDDRRKFMYKRLNEIPGISCVEPEGAFYAFPDISGTGLSSMDFSSKLLDEALVAVVPGKAFGSDNHVRLSYASSLETIEKGMTRIEEWIKNFL